MSDADNTPAVEEEEIDDELIEEFVAEWEDPIQNAAGALLGPPEPPVDSPFSVPKVHQGGCSRP